MGSGRYLGKNVNTFLDFSVNNTFCSQNNGRALKVVDLKFKKIFIREKVFVTQFWYSLSLLRLAKITRKYFS